MTTQKNGLPLYVSIREECAADDRPEGGVGTIDGKRSGWTIDQWGTICALTMYPTRLTERELDRVKLIPHLELKPVEGRPGYYRSEQLVTSSRWFKTRRVAMPRKGIPAHAYDADGIFIHQRFGMGGF